MKLFSAEIEEQRAWLSSRLVWTFVALFCAALAVIFAALFFVIALWETHRPLALGIPAILFLLGAALAWLVVRGKGRVKPRLFAASLTELSKDLKGLNPRL